MPAKKRKGELNPISVGPSAPFISPIRPETSEFAMPEMDEIPEFAAPEWDEKEISRLTQQRAAPGKKVYCMFCKYFHSIGAYSDIMCIYPDNIENRPILGDWYTDVGRDYGKKHPSKLNAKNNCMWFKKKCYNNASKEAKK